MSTSRRTSPGAFDPSRTPDPSVTPDLLYSEEEEELRATLRRLLGDRCDPAAVLARSESNLPHDRDLWKALAADMGLAALLVPERFGGLAATPREAAVVLEELGRFVAPVPFLTSAVMATGALLGCLADEGEAVAAELLTELAAGRAVAVLAVPLATAPGVSPPATSSAPQPASPSASPRPGRETPVRLEDGALHGRIAGVADAAVADVLLVPAGRGLYAVDTGQDGVRTTPQTALDRTRPLAEVAFTAARGRRIADAARAEDALDRALRTGAGLLASEQLGVAEWCLAETVRYTRERHQFNRPVGSFQALKHRLAHLWLETVHARAAARNAADTLARSLFDETTVSGGGTPSDGTGTRFDGCEAGDESALAAALAQAYTSGVAVHAAEEALQLHGGIGMTWEHPVHLYLKRAKADSIALGTAAHHHAQLARLTGLAAPG